MVTTPNLIQILKADMLPPSMAVCERAKSTAAATSG
jgi:hypothetical protein